MKQLTKLAAIVLCIIVLTCLVVFVFSNDRLDPKPLLIFKGYEKSSTNTTQIARFELRNSTKRDIWLCLSGTEFPLRLPFLVRPLVKPPNATRTNEFNLHTVMVGHFFTQAKKLVPGETLNLDYPVFFGDPTEEVGFFYYTGNFTDDSDFLDNMGTPLLDQNGGLGERIDFLRTKLRRWRKTPERHEIWNEHQISFQGDETQQTNSAGPSTNAR